MGKLEAVAEGAAGGNNGISEAQSADVNAEIDRASGGHIGCRITRSAGDTAKEFPAETLRRCENFFSDRWKHWHRLLIESAKMTAVALAETPPALRPTFCRHVLPA